MISDITEFTSQHDLPRILTLLDFHKAFALIEWSIIKGTPHYFNYRSNIKRWVSIFYTSIKSVVLDNSTLTNLFKPSKGILSPLTGPSLFILSAELLSNKIRIEGEKNQVLLNADLEPPERALKFMRTSGKLMRPTGVIFQNTF